MTGLKQALQAFWGGFGVPAYLSDSVPSGAAYPYITYEAVQPAALGFTVLTATGWHSKAPSGNLERTALMDSIAAAIPDEGVLLPVDGGFLALYRNDSNFQSDVRDEDDDTVLGGRTSYVLRFYAKG